MNSWRLAQKLNIENACLLIAGLDPWITDSTRQVASGEPSGMNAIAMASVTVDEPKKIQTARAWLFRARQAVIAGKLKQEGTLRLWGTDGYWSAVEAHEVTKSELDRLDFDISRNALYAWLIEAGYEKSDLPEFLKGADKTPAKDKPVMPKERNSYLKVIAGLLKAQGFDYEQEKPHSLGGRLQKHLELQGIEIGSKTLAKVIDELKEL